MADPLIDDVRYEPPHDFSPLLIESLAKRGEVLAKIEVVRQILTGATIMEVGRQIQK